MKTRTIFTRTLPLLIAGFAVWMSGCSYVVDAIEGAIMNRSSFTIEASYSGGFVDIAWDESDTSDDFAGWEIYMTTDPDDEYSGYATVAAKYDLGSPGIPGMIFATPGALGIGTTGTYSVNVSTLTYTGVYFFRVGKIHWDEDDPAKRDPDTELYYESATNIDAISGGARVEIP
ncbi:MAG: hypothetical protein EPN93_13800 [Spirochaetes bacterium]|nr:MAG: hypothetical protein EPN93_13800 [Spirochaetota bacterium]